MSSQQAFLQSDLLAEKNIWHGFTTRQLGADYDRIAVAFKILSSQIYYVEQVHGADVYCVGEETEFADLQPADALVTARKDIIIGIRTADCVPVLLRDPKQEVIAAVHAGYKGLLSGIIQNTLRVMQENFDCDAENIIAVIGPAICTAHYEVGEEVIAKFKQRYGARFLYNQNQGEKPHLNLAGTAAIILEDEGVLSENSDTLELCTYEDKDNFFSYRRDASTGRQFNFIGMMS